MAEFICDIVTNVFVMLGVMWLIEKFWCDVMCREMHIYVQQVVSFFVMMALALWRVMV